MLLRSNKISGTAAKCEKVINGFFILLCGFRKYPFPPPPHGRDLSYDPPPLWIFQNRPPKFTPPPLRNFQIFALPLEILLSLIEVNKEVVLFTRMPNFVSFMYFLLNCITDKRIPYALKSQTNFVRFM